MKNICVFGASITSGLLDNINGGWVDMLKRSLMPNGYSVFNLGISGENTFDLLHRMEQECKPRRPVIVIIAIGGNDSQFLIDKNEHHVEVDQTKNNFIQMFQIAHKFTDNIVVVGLTKVDEDAINEKFIKELHKYYKNETLEQYNDAIENVSKENDVHFVPTIDLIEPEDLEDGLHPNPNGHKKIFERILDDLTRSRLVTNLD